MRFLFLITLSLLVFSCKTSKKSLDADPAEAPSLIMSMKKTACYGTCPVYEIQIYSDLTVYLSGERHLDQIGNFKSTISGEKFEYLRSQFRDIEFFDLEDKYWEAYTDLPTTYVYFSDQGKEKKIEDYVGAPQKLKNLEKEIAGLLDDLEWEQIEVMEEKEEKE